MDFKKISLYKFDSLTKCILYISSILISISSFGQDSPCDCGETGKCVVNYYDNQTTGEQGANGGGSANVVVLSGDNLATDNGQTYQFCYDYTTKATETRIAFKVFLITPQNCNETRTYEVYSSGGCANSSLTEQSTITDVNGSEWHLFDVTSNTAYSFCVTSTFDVTDTDCDANSSGAPAIVNNFEAYMYDASPPGCTSTIGTIAVTGATANGAEWDLSPGTNNLSLTASGYVLPTDGGVGTCVATYGYFVFDQAPTLPFTDITTIKTQPGFKGISTGVICTDGNTAGKSTSVTTAGKLWFIPFTADCKKINVAAPGNILDIDANADDCYAIGTTPIIINYLSTTPVVSCGTCATPTCPISSATGTTSANGSSNLSMITNASTGASDPISYDASSVSNTSYTNYHTITVTNSNQILGMKQLISASPSGSCATRTYELKATCAGAVIAPNLLNANGVSSGMNPEWNNLPAGTYILSITTTSSSPTCVVYYSTTGYYLVNLPVPPCPVDQTFIELDWTQANPFVAFPSTTYTCNSGPQTIWKNVEAATIGTPGKLQAFPGFQMEMTTNASASTNSSALVSVNGVPFSYYGPALTAPAGVLDWGPIAQSLSIIEPYIPAGATVTILIKDLRPGAQSFPYTVYDHSTGATLTSGTAAPRSSTPITITFTLSSPTMTWKLDGGTANIINNNNGSATFNPSNLTSGPHSIVYTWTNNAGCSITATQNITVGATTPAPTTSSIAYCQGAATVPLTVTLSAGCTQNWYSTNSTGGTAVATAPTPVSTTAGPTTYYVSQTNTATGCESPRTPLVVTINASDNSDFTLTPTCDGATASKNDVTTTGQYSFTTTTAAIDVNTGTITGGTSNTTYDVTYTTSGTCPTTSTKTVTVITEEIPAISCGTSTLSSVEFTVTNTLTGVTSFNVSYIINSGTATIDNNVSFPYVVSGLSSNDIVDITVTPVGTGCYSDGTGQCTANGCSTPTITNPSNESACEGNTASFSITETGGNGFRWELSTDNGVNFSTVSDGGIYSGATTNTLSISDNTGLDTYLYRVVVTEANNSCPSTSTSALLTSYRLPTISGVISTCISQTSQLTGNNTPSAIAWSSANPSIVSIDNTGLITGISQGSSLITYTDNNTCVNTTTVSIQVNETPTINCGASSTSSVTFDWIALTGATSYDITYTVNGGAPQNGGNQTTTSFSVTGLNLNEQVEISVAVNGSGCYQTGIQPCTTDNCTPPVSSFLPSPAKVNTINPITNMINSSTDATSYLWDFGDGETSTEENPTKTYSDLDTGTYLVTLTAFSGACSDVSSYYVKVVEDLVYYIPNTFTPDNNEYNPQFRPEFKSGYDTENYAMNVFDRWGEIVFSTTNIIEGWSGLDIRTNKLCLDGTYTWTIQFGEKGVDKRQLISGHVNLLR